MQAFVRLPTELVNLLLNAAGYFDVSPYWQYAGSNFVLVYCISLDEYHISPVNICCQLHLFGAHLDFKLVFC